MAAEQHYVYRCDAPGCGAEKAQRYMVYFGAVPAYPCVPEGWNAVQVNQRHAIFCDKHNLTLAIDGEEQDWP